jgi:hypothetical protein
MTHRLEVGEGPPGQGLLQVTGGHERHVEATTGVFVDHQATAQHAEAVGVVRVHVCDRTEQV